jgi:hypothetical protein
MASLLAYDIAVVVFIGIFRLMARAFRHGITMPACPSLNIRDDPRLLIGRAFEQAQPGIAIHPDHGLRCVL